MTATYCYISFMQFHAKSESTNTLYSKKNLNLSIKYFKMF